MTGRSLKNQSRVKSSQTTTLYRTHNVYKKGANISCFSQLFARGGWHHKANQEGSAKHTPPITPLPTLWIPSLTTRCALKEQLNMQTISQGIHLDDSTKPPGDPVGEGQRHRQPITRRPSSSPYCGPFHHNSRRHWFGPRREHRNLQGPAR